jgi:hypothetical protein
VTVRIASVFNIAHAVTPLHLSERSDVADSALIGAEPERAAARALNDQFEHVQRIGKRGSAMEGREGAGEQLRHRGGAVKWLGSRVGALAKHEDVGERNGARCDQRFVAVPGRPVHRHA